MAGKKSLKVYQSVSVRPNVLLDIDKGDLSGWDYDALVEMGRSVVEVKGYSQWILGKLAVEVLRRHNELDDYAKQIGMARGTLWNYASVYRRFTEKNPNFNPDVYYGSVPWGVLHLLAHSKVENVGEFLDRMVDEGKTSKEQVYRELKSQESDEEVPRKPRVSFKWDGEKKKWMIKFNMDDWSNIGWDLVGEDLINKFKELFRE